MIVWELFMWKDHTLLSLGTEMDSHLFNVAHIGIVE